MNKCKATTYMPTTGSALEADCVDCDGGHYCDVDGMDTPKACPTGKYCPTKTKLASDAKACAKGYSCPTTVYD
jgi:hypothetical protein